MEMLNSSASSNPEDALVVTVDDPDFPCCTVIVAGTVTLNGAVESVVTPTASARLEVIAPPLPLTTAFDPQPVSGIKAHSALAISKTQIRIL